MSEPKIGKPSKTVKPKTSFDGYCPLCRSEIGWDVLSDLFVKQSFDPDRTFSKKVTCPHCDEVLNVTMLIDFSLAEIIDRQPLETLDSELASIPRRI